MILVLGTDYVITYHRRRLDAVDQVKATCVDSFQLAGKTPGFIAFLFLQRCLYDYAHLNLANDNYLDLLEGEPAAGGRGGVPESVGIAARNILTLKKLAASLHIVLMLLGTKRSRFVSDEGRNSFLEMLRNALAIREAIDSSRDLLDGILGGHPGGGRQPDQRDRPGADRGVEHHAAADPDRRHLRHELREHAGAQVAARLPGRPERDGRGRAGVGRRVLAARLAGRDLGAPVREEEGNDVIAVAKVVVDRCREHVVAEDVEVGHRDVSARGDSRDGASEILGDGLLNHRVDGLPVV
jgi:hypothetical protein